MNTTLTPGVRKLPSALDIQILNTLRNPQPIDTVTLDRTLNEGTLAQLSAILGAKQSQAIPKRLGRSNWKNRSQP
jgi:hypothetical protein